MHHLFKPNLVYAGIGRRECPEPVIQEIKVLASTLASKYNATLRSGAAAGADTAFEYGAIAGNGPREIYLPWSGFNNRYCCKQVMHLPQQLEVVERVAANYHPAWNRCSPAARKLTARNVLILLGKDPELVPLAGAEGVVFNVQSSRPVDFVICWTERGQITGGTGNAIRVAQAYNIPVFNLGIPSDKQMLYQALSEDVDYV